MMPARVAKEMGPLGARQTAHKTSETAGAVAAHFGRTAVAVEEVPGPIGFAGRARFQQNDAVGADALVPVAQAGDLRGLQLQEARAIVDQDEIVARAVHFGKVHYHGSTLTCPGGRFQVEIVAAP